MKYHVIDFLNGNDFKIKKHISKDDLALTINYLTGWDKKYTWNSKKTISRFSKDIIKRKVNLSNSYKNPISNQPSPIIRRRKNCDDVKISLEYIHVYTDGSWHNIEKDMGIGIAAQYKNKEITYSAYIGKGTNNIAELTAIEVALKKLKKYSAKPFKIYTDSQYCIGVLSMNWNAKKNIELITRIKDLISEFDNVKFIKVKGHSNNLMNNLADKLAVDARKNRK